MIVLILTEKSKKSSNYEIEDKKAKIFELEFIEELDYPFRMISFWLSLDRGK